MLTFYPSPWGHGSCISTSNCQHLSNMSQWIPTWHQGVWAQYRPFSNERVLTDISATLGTLIDTVKQWELEKFKTQMCLNESKCFNGLKVHSESSSSGLHRDEFKGDQSGTSYDVQECSPSSLEDFCLLKQSTKAQFTCCLFFSVFLISLSLNE